MTSFFSSFIERYKFISLLAPKEPEIREVNRDGYIIHENRIHFVHLIQFEYVDEPKCHIHLRVVPQIGNQMWYCACFKQRVDESDIFDNPAVAIATLKSRLTRAIEKVEEIIYHK